MPIPFDVTQFGAGYGQVVASGGPTPLINGLTVSQYVTVTNAANSGSIAYLGDSFVTKVNGYALEQGKSIILDTGNSRSRWYVTTDGATARVSWITATPTV